MTPPHTPSPLAGRSLRAPVLWGIVFGAIQAAALVVLLAVGVDFRH